MLSTSGIVSPKAIQYRWSWLAQWGTGGLTYSDVGLYTDESPGLKVDPVVVLVLSLVFIFSVVALHSKLLEPKSVVCVFFVWAAANASGARWRTKLE
jgi:hypothetical protein